MKHEITIGDTFYVVCGTLYDGRVRQVQYEAVRVASEDVRIFHTQKGTINKRSGRYRYDALCATQELYTYEEVRQKEWVKANSQKIVWKLEHVKDYGVLFKVGELIGYEGAPVTVHMKE